MRPAATPDTDAVVALFDRCLDLDAAACARALAEAPAAVADEVRRLLEHDRAAGDFLAAPALPPLPARLGRFEIGGRLGEGGMGVVYEGHDPQLGRAVAIKVLGGFRLDPQRRAQLLGEAQALARVSHPHVVPVFEAGEHEGQVYVVMELIRGVTLRQWLSTPRPWRAALEHVLAAGEGLAAIHRAGLVHRDIKPENVLIGDDGRARVLDLGLATARSVEPLGAPASSGPEPLIGTPRYLAPERWRGATADARSDQFELAVTLFEALTGAHPLGAAPAWSARTPAPPLPAALPEALRAPLGRALDPDPARRFSRVDDLLVALRHAVASHDDDLSIGRTPRALIGAGLLLLPPIGYLRSKAVLSVDAPAMTLLSTTLFMVTPALVLAALLWSTLARNAVSRQVRRMLLAMPLLLMASRLSSALLGVTVAEAFARDLLVLAGPLVFAAPQVHRGLLVPALVGVAGSVVLSWQPALALEGFVVFASSLYITIFIAWLPRAGRGSR